MSVITISLTLYWDFCLAALLNDQLCSLWISSGMSDDFPVIKTFVANMQAHTCNSLDLIETLVRLGDSNSTEVAQCVREHRIGSHGASACSSVIHCTITVMICMYDFGI